MITPDNYELPPAVSATLSELVIAILDVEDPLERVACIKAIQVREEHALAALLTFAIREAREHRHTFADIGHAYGVTGQRAHQLARTNEDQPTIEETRTP